MRKLYIGYVKDSTIQQSIFVHIVTNERPCKRKKTIIYEDSRDVEEEDICPVQGMRQTSVVNSFSACPWVMTIYAISQTKDFHCFQTLDDISKQVVVPRDIQYSLLLFFFMMERITEQLVWTPKIHMGIMSSMTE